MLVFKHKGYFTLLAIYRQGCKIFRIMNDYDAALKVIMSLNSAGYDAFLVGGCVRSFLMNLPPSDFDIATSASVEEAGKVLDCRPIGSGEKHGTVRLLLTGRTMA